MKIMTKKINLKITIEETAERHPVPVLGTDYKVKIIYKNIKVAELDVEDKIINGAATVYFHLDVLAVRKRTGNEPFGEEKNNELS